MTDTPISAARYRNGALLCNARQNTCGANAVKGGTKCRMHGGASLRGLAHPNFKHGNSSKYLKYLRGDLRAKMQRLSEADLMDNLDDLALLHARLAQLLESGESISLWRSIRTTWQEFRAAFQRNDLPAVQEALNELDLLIARSEQSSQRWEEIYEIQGRLVRTRESEHKRQRELQQFISVGEITELLNVLCNSIITNVNDQVVLSRISKSFEELVGPNLVTIPRKHLMPPSAQEDGE